MLFAPHIPALQDLASAFWHDPHLSPPEPANQFEELVLEQHRANFDLWHQEDNARDPAATDAGIASVKRTIDKLNQRRNDLTEQIDVSLLNAAQQSPAAPLHSETPGLIIDRLSILALKLFHTAEQIGRTGTSPEHRDRNRERLRVLQEQRADLAQCLAQLWEEVNLGTRRFKLYRQLKMYNDPSLNPVLYRAREGENIGQRPADAPDQGSMGGIDQTGLHTL